MWADQMHETMLDLAEKAKSGHIERIVFSLQWKSGATSGATMGDCNSEQMLLLIGLMEARKQRMLQQLDDADRPRGGIHDAGDKRGLN